MSKMNPTNGDRLGLSEDDPLYNMVSGRRNFLIRSGRVTDYSPILRAVIAGSVRAGNGQVSIVSEDGRREDCSLPVRELIKKGLVRYQAPEWKYEITDLGELSLRGFELFRQLQIRKAENILRRTR